MVKIWQSRYKYYLWASIQSFTAIDENLSIHILINILELQWKREQAYTCVRAEATKRGLVELQKQIEYKELKKQDIHKIRARELAILDADRAAMEADKKKCMFQYILLYTH